jgi:hypothetical protein
MKDLIRKILSEYETNTLVYEIVIGKTLLEQDFIRQLNNSDISLYKNKHSQINIGNSKFSRVDPKIIDVSIYDNQEDIVDLAKYVVNNCISDSCSMIVVDEPNGFDYHVWLEKTKSGNIRMTINTSINHPKHLYNSERNPMLIITMRGDIRTRFV